MDDTPPTPTDPQTPPPAAQPTPQPAPPAKGRKRRWPRRIAWTLAVVLLLLVGLVALGPTLASTGPGTSLIASVSQGQINGKLRLSGLSVGWFSGTKLAEAVVEDDKGIRVAELANLDTGLTLWGLVRGRYDLGDASLRLSLPTVVIRPDGTTNLDHVFKLDEPSTGNVEIPDLAGSLKVDGEVTVQYLPPPTTRPTDGLTPSTQPVPPPPVSVNFDGTKLVFGPNKSLNHTLPLSLRVNAGPAGTITAVGDVDLNSLAGGAGDVPTIKEKLDIQNLKLAAISTLLPALGITDVDLAGDFGGTLDADTTANTLAANFVGSDIVATQRGTAGAADLGYQTKRLTLTADGDFAFADDATKRLIVTLRSSKLATDDLAAALAGTFDPLRADPLAHFATLAKDLKLDVQSDFLKVSGGGPNLGLLTLDASGDVDNFRKRFGNLVDFGDLDPSGRFTASLKTQRKLVPDAGPSLVIAYDLDVERIKLTLPPAAPADAADRPAGAISSEPTVPVVFRLGKVTAKGEGSLTKDSRSLAGATTTFAVLDASNKTLAEGRVTLEDADAETQSVGRATLESLSLPDYAALRRALAGVADLPEPASPVGKIDLTAAASYDGGAKKLTLSDPLRVLLDGRPLATVAGGATRSGGSLWQADALAADLFLPVADTLLKSLGTELSAKEPVDGQVTIRAAGDAPLRFDTSDVVGTLAGTIEVAMEKARAQGMTASGRFPVTLQGLKFTVPESAAPLGVNGGTVYLAGATFDATGEKSILRLPQPPKGRQLAENVSINPVLGELLGKYVNPFLVGAAEASGLLDAEITSDTPLNLTDLTGPNGGKVDVRFNLRDLRLVNPKIRELVGPNLAQLNSLPGVNIPLPPNLDTLEGNILDARVGLDNGTADTDITFNVADPRELVGRGKVDQGALTLYPLHFGGSVNLSTYAIKLDLGIPQSLVEKWWPDDVSFIKPLKPTGGATLALGGTTFRPTLPAFNSASLADLAGKAAKERAADELDKRLPEQFKGIGDLLRGGKKDNKDK